MTTSCNTFLSSSMINHFTFRHFISASLNKAYSIKLKLFMA